MHIWRAETTQERAAAQRELDILNAEREPKCREEWELATAMRRMNLRRNPGGRKPVWKFTKKTGKLVRDSTGGIDWWRYGRTILMGKLLPFAKECLKERPGTIVQEDKAPSHAHSSQAEIYSLFEIQRLLWPGNSSDLNMIEPAWPHPKRKTTWIPGPPRTRAVAEARWIKEWKDLEQSRIQAWIERIPHHIQEIICLEGGNEYKEGRKRNSDVNSDA